MIALLALVWLGLAGFALPDHDLTPGQTMAVSHGDLCRPGYTSEARHVTVAMKRAVCAMYEAAQCPGPRWEIDHLISLELGGSNALSNLWPQPIKEARRKDVLESFLHRAVCSGAMTLHDAQRSIAEDWPAAYEAMQGR